MRNMKSRELVRFAVVLLLVVFCEPVGYAFDHPNIVYILADDFGYGDASCYNPNSKIATPNIDSLAARGMQFTDAHTPSAVCTPTRYGILTGRYCWRTRLKYRVLDGLDPPLIESSRLTVPSLLKRNGYHTICIGKWHLGMEWTDMSGNAVPAVPVDRKTPPRDGRNVDYSVPMKGGPTAVGFDRFFGISASLNMSPFCYLVDDRPVIRPTIESPAMKSEFISVDQGIRSHDFSIAGVMPTLNGQAIRHIDEHVASGSDKPFFLYFPLTAPHLPVIPNVEFLGSSDAGMYGDFVREVDATVGAITETIQRHGISENTLVIFTSDNGGLYHWWTPQEADDIKHYKVGVRGQYVKDFGHQGNAHLRGTKADIWEGGHRVPFITTWPRRIAAGSTSDALVELTDLLATSAAIIGEELTTRESADSRNILPIMLGQATEKPIRDFAVHHSLWGRFAIRRGPWKMIPARGSGGFTRPRDIQPAAGEPVGQLYNLEDDPSETTNLWGQHPELVRELGELLESVQAWDR
jgi:arylsulfatase A-like enzyme